MTEFRKLINLVEGVSDAAGERLDELRFPWFRKKAEQPQVDLSRLNRQPQAAPQEEPAAEPVAHGKPEIGTTFTYQGKTYIVTGYMTEIAKAGVFGKRGGELVACFPPKATWVMGMGGGGAGTVAPIRAIAVQGPSKWSPEVVQLVSDKAEMLVQKRYTIKAPPTRR